MNPHILLVAPVALLARGGRNSLHNTGEEQTKKVVFPTTLMKMIISFKKNEQKINYLSRFANSDFN